MSIEEKWMSHINNYYEIMKKYSKCNNYNGKRFEDNEYLMLVIRTTDRKSMLISRLNLDKGKSRTKMWINDKQILDKEYLHEIDKRRFFGKKKSTNNKDDGSR